MPALGSLPRDPARIQEAKIDYILSLASAEKKQRR
jgi:hypothetical protein